jgi:hypothetical protein
MAVNFQRRNIGVLADTPTFEDVGRSSYTDYAAAAAQQAPAAMREEVAAADAAPAAINPDDYEARARAALTQMEEAALRQKKAAGNPLNVASSIIGGVVGLPFSFLENAIGGGNNDLTAPFRPKQTADARYQASLAAIGEKRAEFERDLAGVRSSNATAMKTAMGMDREENQAGVNQLGQLTSSMLYMDDAARAERLPVLATIAKRFPNVAPYVQDIIDNGFNPAVLATYGSMATDEGARQRSNEYLYGNKTIPTGDGTALVVSGRPGVAPQFVDRSAEDPNMRTLTGLPLLTGRGAPAAVAPEPTMENTPQPTLGPNGLPEYLTPAQYSIISKQLGKEKTDAWIKQNNIVVEQPQTAPPADAIDAELRRRGVIK